MTVRRRHLQCDMRETCVSCTVYTWSPKLKEPKKFFYCRNCNKDILCERGLSISLEYYEDGAVQKIVKCTQCEIPLLEKIWPTIPEKLKRAILKIE